MSGPVLRYSAARVALFLAALALVSLVGVRGLLAVFAALVLSALASAVLLKGLRDRIADAALARREQKEAERARLRQRLADEG